VRIGAYEVLGELGRGGMGAVFRVRGRDGREAALKLLRSVDGAAFARFDRERRLLASLGEDQGFVGLVDAGTVSAGAWLLMPLMTGGTLRGRLEQGPLGVEEAIALGVRLAEALGAAHERGIIHRDVKPENVLFSGEGRPLVADLGLAKHFDRLAGGASQSVSLTRDGSFKGTAGYAAPEQLEDARCAGPPADVFALGAVLHECLAGKPAFPGENMIETMARVSVASYEPIGRKDVPAWLEAVLRRALARDPRARFASGAALARALRDRSVKEVPRRSRLAVALVLAGATVVLAAGALALHGDAAGKARELADQGEAKAKVEDDAGAITLFSRAIELDPGLARAWRERGRAHANRREWAAAAADEERAIELDPGAARSWAIRARVRLESGDLDGVIADETKAIALDPKVATFWVTRGIARDRKGDGKGALADETKGIELDPGIASAWLCRGKIRGEAGDFDGAIADETKALELDPKLAVAWLDRGWARGRKGDWAGQVADSTKAIELEPKNSVAWRNRGWARFEKGDWDEAIEDTTRAIELDPGVGRAWSNRAMARGRKGDRAGAMEDASRAVELDPRIGEAWRVRGDMRAQEHDLGGAVSDLSRALELDPSVASAWLNRGVARLQSGAYDAGISDFSKAIELEPGLAVAWANRGVARSNTDDVAGGIADLEHALELEPSGPASEQFRKFLDQARARQPR
jgi:tetratricopeptide (TPR) repeat protein